MALKVKLHEQSSTASCECKLIPNYRQRRQNISLFAHFVDAHRKSKNMRSHNPKKQPCHAYAMAVELGIFDPKGHVLFLLTRCWDDHSQADEALSAKSNDILEGDEGDAEGLSELVEEPKPAVEESENYSYGIDTPKKTILSMAEIRMRVSSKHMILASSVLAAMPDNDCREGLELQSNGNCAVLKPNGNPVAFKILLDIIHSRTKWAPHRQSNKR